MTRHRIPRVLKLPAFALAAAASVLACSFAGGAHAAAPKKAKAAEVAQPAGEPVEYEALEGRIGAQVVIETTLNTVRRGTLVRYTNPTLTLQLGPEAGSIELSVPHETVRSIRVIDTAASAQPAAGDAQEKGNGSAKKN